VRRSGVIGGLGGFDTSERERFQSSLAPVEEETEVIDNEESERSMRGDSAGDMSARKLSERASDRAGGDEAEDGEEDGFEDDL